MRPERGGRLPTVADTLHAVFDEMSEGVQIIDHEGRYLYLNLAAARQGRRPLDELEGRRMTEVYPGIEQTHMYTLLKRCVRDHEAQQMVNQFTYPDGSSAWFDLRMTPVAMGVLIMSVDITAQKTAEEELRRSREELAITLDSVPDALISADADQRIVGMNPAAEDMIGWTEAQAIGRRLDEVMSFLNQQTGEPIDHAVQRVLRDGVKIGLANDTMLVRSDGVRLPIASSGAPIRDADGNVAGVVLVLKNMQTHYDMVARLYQSEKMGAMGRLAGGIAHDFNNLLTVMAGYCDVVLDELPADAPHRGELEEIARAAQQATGLTRQLLAFSRGQVLTPQLLDLNQVVRTMQNMLRRIIGEEIELRTELAAQLPKVRFDPGQIERIIMNLVVNARDAIPMHGTITIGTRAGENGSVVLEISDDGVGMDEDTRARVFEPFFTTKAEGHGTGLGLATTYGIVEQSGGSIVVESEVGRGTRFVVELPGLDAG